MKNECLGCFTTFSQNQKVQLESLTVQFKNYSLPLKDEKHKWVLIKTITSMLNSKGGTIFIGVDDTSGKAQGIYLERKERDTFMLTLKFLMEKISPKIDLNSKEQVKVTYVPVLNNKTFEGKFIVKIIVSQGDPSKVYTICQKIKLQDSSNKKTEQFEIYKAYVRHGMAGTQQLKGLLLLEQIHKKAIKPSPISNIFHEGCNPNPLNYQLSIKKIFFTNIKAEASKMLQEMFLDQLQQMDIDPQETTYEKEKKTIIISFDEDQQCSQAIQFIKQNLEVLNTLSQSINFNDRGAQKNYHIFENAVDVNKKENNQIKKEHKQEKKTFKMPQKKKIEQKPSRKHESKELKSGFPKKYSITFTHICPKKDEQLIEFISKTNGQGDIECSNYKNTIEFFFKTENQLQKCYKYCHGKSRQLNDFGFKQDIRYGYNSGMLAIYNYDKNKKEELKKYVKSVMGTDLKQIDFVKDKGYCLLCCMKEKSSACLWLDILLGDKNVKKFKIPGNQDCTKKMKIFLIVDSPFM